MADAGTSVGAGHEEQKSEHGKLREAGVGLELIHCHPINFEPYNTNLPYI